MRFRESGNGGEVLEQHVASSIGGKRPARVRLIDGSIVREAEVSGYGVDRSRLGTSLVLALSRGGVLEVPLMEAPKRLPDSELAKINDVVSEYSTSFPRSQTSRNANLRLASERLDGVVLMPGEVFSFNETVGERTVRDGFRLAGVYRNGRHDVGIGGGICQVSGTLYNAILLSNAKIVQRRNHSMPVPYLSVGRDATVDWGKIDLQFQNSFDHPIAISSSFEPGKLTFRILGQKDPTLSVKIVTADHRSWGRGVKYVHDGSLQPGKSKVIEKGSSGHSVLTYRVVLKNGVEVSRELLGRSQYPGGVRIVARNEKAMAGEPKPADGGVGAPTTPVDGAGAG
jgi:vancomycin resistance protein YoaR